MGVEARETQGASTLLPSTWVKFSPSCRKPPVVSWGLPGPWCLCPALGQGNVSSLACVFSSPEWRVTDYKSVWAETTLSFFCTDRAPSQSPTERCAHPNVSEEQGFQSPDSLESHWERKKGPGRSNELGKACTSSGSDHPWIIFPYLRSAACVTVNWVEWGWCWSQELRQGGLGPCGLHLRGLQGLR